MFLIIYMLLINSITFFLFGTDKRRAKRQEWRIPERTLLLFTVLGGSAGALIGMYVFHHKIRKWKFRAGVPVILAAHIMIWISVKMLLTNNII